VALGELFEAGQGVPRDEAQAANWYRRAAEQGYANAQYNLAALYAVGKGVPLNNAKPSSGTCKQPIKAIRWPSTTWACVISKATV
jgi:TPR repeat protein